MLELLNRIGRMSLGKRLKISLNLANRILLETTLDLMSTRVYLLRQLKYLSRLHFADEFLIIQTNLRLNRIPAPLTSSCH
jgi:hypothetical protein